jgi:hypothetical protein
MHDEALIRRICGEISGQKNENKLSELIALLRAAVGNDIEKAQLRMNFLRTRYAMLMDQGDA